MTRVLHSLNLIVPGGVERTRQSLLERLPPGYEHRAVCVEICDQRFARRLEPRMGWPVELGPIHSVLRPSRYRRAAEVIEDWQPDIVHGAVIEGYTVGGVAGRWKRVPVVIMEETSDARMRRRKGHILARAMAGLADHCIAVSPDVARYLTETLRVPNHKVSVVNNGVEVPETPSPELLAELREQFRFDEGLTIIGSVGQMNDDTKRFDDLIRGFARLRDDNTRLLLVGDGTNRPGLEALAVDLGVEKRVVFAGFQRHPGRCYALMDIFALTSEREAFGLVNAEAMRCGLPVVATRVGGIPDVVVDGSTGILCDARDVAAIADALSVLVENDALRSSLGAAGKVRADREFSAERYANDVHELYQSLLAERRR